MKNKEVWFYSDLKSFLKRHNKCGTLGRDAHMERKTAPCVGKIRFKNS